MSNVDWNTEEGFSLTFSSPRLQAFNDKPIKTMDDVLHFYYDLTVKKGSETLLEASPYDFPQVQNLPTLIDYVRNVEKKDMLVISDDSYSTIYYSVVNSDNPIRIMSEYTFKIERTTGVIDENDTDEQEYTFYTLTLSTPVKDVDSDGTVFASSVQKAIVFEDLTDSDLENLKKVAKDFCELAIELSNKEDLEV